MTLAPTPRETAPLRITRFSSTLLASPQAPGDGALPAQTLGALCYGPAHSPAPDGLYPLAVSPLLHSQVQADLWQAPGRVRAGCTGHMRWRATPEWLFGAIDLDAADEAEGVEALAHRAYADLFATLREHGQPRLLRLWN